MAAVSRSRATVGADSMTVSNGGRCPDCWRPDGRHAASCPSHPACPKCGEPMGEPEVTISGVCRTHGIQVLDSTPKWYPGYEGDHTEDEELKVGD